MGNPWTTELELKGAGGEPVDLWRTLTSHGVAALPPQVLDEEEHTLESTLLLPRGRGRTIRIRAGRPGRALLKADGRVSAADRALLAETAAHMLRLDADLSAFYEAAGEDPDLSWVPGGAGRMLRSPTVFEEVIKTTSPRLTPRA
jgi:3-methyladenine DNA glycosylase/8-oxoguanine DNA glycosylase